MTPAQTPERPVKYSDEEIRKAWGQTHVFLGKVDVLREFLAALGAVHPAEVREREREAWDECWYWATAETTKLNGGRGHASDRPSESERDKRYPPLPPKSPPPLVLSTGTWTRRKEGFLWMQGDVGVASLSGEPIRRNATDNELYAKWLRAYGSTEEAK